MIMDFWEVETSAWAVWFVDAGVQVVLQVGSIDSGDYQVDVASWDTIQVGATVQGIFWMGTAPWFNFLQQVTYN